MIDDNTIFVFVRPMSFNAIDVNAKFCLFCHCKILMEFVKLVRRIRLTFRHKKKLFRVFVYALRSNRNLLAANFFLLHQYALLQLYLWWNEKC